jgi:formate/nitrite transporter FocA (FNT family)
MEKPRDPPHPSAHEPAWFEAHSAHDESAHAAIDAEDVKKAEEAHHPAVGVTYTVIDKAGVSELERSSSALAWSGLAAGLSMGWSFLCQALLEAYLPHASWTPLVSRLGYTIGFLVVILGTQQLFTENTLTALLPVLSRRSGHRWSNMLRLWGVVLMANLVGALLFALVLQIDGLFKPEVAQALDRLAAEAMEPAWSRKLLLAIFAGWLIALMVWMLPAADTLGTLVIIVITYFVALGGFPHVIAGGVEAFHYGLGGGGVAHGVVDYIVPALIGNTIGGTALVAGLAHAQMVGSGRG